MDDNTTAAQAAPNTAPAPDEFAALRLKHPRALEVEVDVPTGRTLTDEDGLDVLNDDGKPVPETELVRFLFKPVNRQVMAAATKVGQRDPLKSVEVLMDTLYLAGPKARLDEDFRLWQSVGVALQEAVGPYDARLKN